MNPSGERVSESGKSSGPFHLCERRFGRFDALA
jgi:hypothetical protein